MYRSILEGIPFLKVYNIAKSAGMSRFVFDDLEERPHVDKVGLYRNLLKEIRKVVETFVEISKDVSKIKEHKSLIKMGFFNKSMTDEEKAEYFVLGATHARNAYDDLLVRYKAAKEEEELEEVGEAVQVPMFIDDTVVESKEEHKQNGAVMKTSRAATPQQIQDFLRTEAGFVRKK